MLATIVHSLHPVDVHSLVVKRVYRYCLEQYSLGSDQKLKIIQANGNHARKKSTQARIKINLTWTSAVQNSVNINEVHVLQKSKHNETVLKQLVYQNYLIVNFIQLLQKAYKHRCHQKNPEEVHVQTILY